MAACTALRALRDTNEYDFFYALQPQAGTLALSRRWRPIQAGITRDGRSGSEMTGAFRRVDLGLCVLCRFPHVLKNCYYKGTHYYKLLNHMYAYVCVVLLIRCWGSRQAPPSLEMCFFEARAGLIQDFTEFQAGLQVSKFEALT